MTKYILRLDDMCERRNIEMWNKVENLIDSYGIKPVVGIIPKVGDKKLLAYKADPNYWKHIHEIKKKGWTIAMHGFNHIYCTKSGGVNPINFKSEFAGLPLEKQKEKIRQGIEILSSNGIVPKVFFAPSHTFDENTLIALKEESVIRIVSDTIAFDIYYKDDFYFVPQQSGKARYLPVRVATFCYHPNTMTTNQYNNLDKFLFNNKKNFLDFNNITFKKREICLYDKILKTIYFKILNIRHFF